MNKINQKGFGIVEGLLVFIAVAIIAGVGFYVYRTSKDNPETAKSDGQKVQQEKQNAKKEPEDETLSWSKLSSLSKKFSFAVPDGWTVTNDTELDYISAIGKENLTYQKGTKAKINNQLGFRGGGGHTVSTFFVQSGNAELLGTYYSQFTSSGSIMTKQGASMAKYTRISPGLEMDPPKGSKSTGFMIKKGELIVVLTYTQVPGETDQSSYVEKAAMTLQLYP